MDADHEGPKSQAGKFGSGPLLVCEWQGFGIVTGGNGGWRQKMNLVARSGGDGSDEALL
jgi:hypothetical protein